MLPIKNYGEGEKVAKIEAKAVWIDPSTIKEQALEYVGQVEYKAKSGAVMKPMLFIGQDGDYYCFNERIANLRQLIKALGDDDTKWIGKRFIIKPMPEIKKVTLVMIP